MNRATQRAIILEAAGPTYSMVAIDADTSPGWKQGYGHTPRPAVVWQMHSLEVRELRHAFQMAREKHPKATISIENKSGRIIKAFKPGQPFVVPAGIADDLDEAAETSTCPSCHRKVAKGAGWCPHCKQDIDEGTNTDRGVNKEDRKKFFNHAYDTIAKQPAWRNKDFDSTFDAQVDALYIKLLRLNKLSEATSLFGTNGAWRPKVGKAVSAFGKKLDAQTRYTEKQCTYLSKWANNYPNGPKREYARDAAKDCLTESTGPKPGAPVKQPTETDRLKTRQAQETIGLKQRQGNELLAAKLRDVATKAREQQVKLNAPKG